MNKKDLIDFEKRVQDVYESGKIKALFIYQAIMKTS
jgi:hypothetical protein